MRRASVAAAGTLAAALLLPALRPAPDLAPDLAGHVAVVTGGGRGIGRGVAAALCEAGATVYITGRSSAPLATACAAAPPPGRCVARVVDSANDTSLAAFFDDLGRETGGRLDILVNNAFSAVEALHAVIGVPFWETGPGLWDDVNNVGLRSHYVASILGARMMSRRKQGLIVQMSSAGGLGYALSVPYGIGKAAIDRMAADMAMELATENVTVVSLWPGVVKTEAVEENVGGGIADAMSRMRDRRGRAPGLPDFPQRALLQTAAVETPLFTGRAVAHLARDRGRAARSGTVQVPAEMARRYGFRDERGVQTTTMPSLKFLAMQTSARAREWGHVPDPPPGACGRAGLCDPPAALPLLQHAFVNWLPDVPIPLTLLKLLGSSPLFSYW